ncbi:oligosaccharide flippase family protein [Nocardia ignorata]|uniref:O-antigen/teichoic acid export membrane protein n=1 Tax=Nocardia ignorata TaxID=145285 RepID=A0A4R6PHS9_NOCIG|nr:oligosaccharide flippase family protein [Nocardia ignorata]TDP37874.1 O-antigen/teichoic acid export membrane protein [Nocardia ignorata]
MSEQTAAIDEQAESRRRAQSGRAAANNTAAMLAARIFAAALGLLGTTLIARSLPTVEWGYFSFVFGLLGMLAIVTDLGVGRAVIGKLVHGDPTEASEVAASFIVLRTVLGLVGYGLAIGYVLVMRCPTPVVAATALAGLVVVIATPSHALTILFQSTMRLTLVAAAESLARCVQLALTVAAVLWAPTLLWVVVPAIAYEVVAVAVKIVAVTRGLGGPIPARRIELRWWGPMLREALPLSIGLALIIMLQKVGLLLLGHADSFEAVGLFAVGMKFADLLDTAAVSVVAPLTTLLIALWPDDPPRFRRYFRQANVALIALGLLALVAFWPVAGQVIGLLFGENFVEAADAGRIQVAAGLLGAVANLGLVALMATGRNALIPWIAALALAVNLGVAWPLIDRMSYEGAAIAGLIAQVVLLIAVWIAVLATVRLRRLLPVATVAALTGVAVAVVGVASLAQRHWAPPWILTCAAACLIYVLIAGSIMRRTEGLTIRSLRGPETDDTVANRSGGADRSGRHGDSPRVRTGADSEH